MLRLRERRWLDGASFDTERGSTSREGEPSLDKKSIPVQSPVSLGEELQWWPDKVGRCTRPADRHAVGPQVRAMAALTPSCLSFSSSGRHEVCEHRGLVL